MTLWQPSATTLYQLLCYYVDAAGVLAEDRDCALVGQVGNWSARNCAERHCFFCEWSEGQKDMAESLSLALGGKSIENSVWQLMLICSACLVYLLWIAEIIILHWKIGVRVRLAKNRKELEGISGKMVALNNSDCLELTVLQLSLYLHLSLSQALISCCTYPAWATGR